MSNLRIDADKCIGCGKCVKMCLEDNLEVVDKKVHEKGTGCIKCGHCVSSCPKGAIELVDGKGETPRKGWMDGSLVSDEDLGKLYESMGGGKTGKDGEHVWVATLQGDELNRYMDDAIGILKEHASDLPVVGEFEKWRERHDMLEPDPVLWDGKQVVFIFSDSAERAFSASNRMIAKGFGMGIRGFHSNTLMMAYKEDPEKLEAYFPGAEGKMHMAFVIGHGRRLIEPLFQPIEKVKGLFRRAPDLDPGPGPHQDRPQVCDLGHQNGIAVYPHGVLERIAPLVLHAEDVRPGGDLHLDRIPRIGLLVLSADGDGGGDVPGPGRIRQLYPDVHRDRRVRLPGIVHRIQADPREHLQGRPRLALD